VELKTAKFIVVPVLLRARMMLSAVPLLKSMMRSLLPAVPVKRASAMIVRPPLVAGATDMLELARNWLLARAKLTYCAFS
jgi:hypothetical protein